MDKLWGKDDLRGRALRSSRPGRLQQLHQNFGGSGTQLQNVLVDDSNGRLKQCGPVEVVKPDHAEPITDRDSSVGQGGQCTVEEQLVSGKEGIWPLTSWTDCQVLSNRVESGQGAVAAFEPFDRGTALSRGFQEPLLSA